MEKIKVVELFAGVGGFRIGLEKASQKYKIVWSNQWEPSTKAQEASDIYIKRFGAEGHSNEDIAKVKTENVPDHNLLVGGFPCQDYSVARSLSESKGIEGKKGVLWWEIYRILKEKKNKPEFLFLENVDRLLKSPASQRGRDFAIILASLSELGYAVEWKIVNAADYGMPQRRRRVFILGYHKNSPIYKKLKDSLAIEWITKKGILAQAFPIEELAESSIKSFPLQKNLVEISKRFNRYGIKSKFENCGLMIDEKIFTSNIQPKYNGPRTILKDIVLDENEIPSEFFIIDSSRKQWEYLKGAKKETRYNKKQNFSYTYAEGSMIFPDSLDSPSRTIVTGEGGASPSRFKHVIQTKNGKLRRLTPIELERLNMFPDNHTEGVSDIKRAFLMGNALVVGVIEIIGKILAEEAKD